MTQNMQLTGEYLRFYQDALAAGFTDAGPIWKHTGTDASVKLIKDDVVIHLVYRMLTRPPRRRGHAPQESLDTHATGWFENGHHGFPDEVPMPFDAQAIEAMRTVCTMCDKTSTEPLTHVGFADKACSACVKEAREKYEFPGWCD